jgi:hypothetical protein
MFFAGDVLRFCMRRRFGGIDDQAYFDGGIGAILNPLDIGSAETLQQQISIRFEELVNVSIVVNVALR